MSSFDPFIYSAATTSNNSNLNSLLVAYQQQCRVANREELGHIESVLLTLLRGDTLQCSQGGYKDLLYLAAKAGMSELFFYLVDGKLAIDIDDYAAYRLLCQKTPQIEKIVNKAFSEGDDLITLAAITLEGLAMHDPLTPGSHYLDHFIMDYRLFIDDAGLALHRAICAGHKQTVSLLLTSDLSYTSSPRKLKQIWTAILDRDDNIMYEMLIDDLVLGLAKLFDNIDHVGSVILSRDNEVNDKRTLQKIHKKFPYLRLGQDNYILPASRTKRTTLSEELGQCWQRLWIKKTEDQFINSSALKEQGQ